MKTHATNDAGAVNFPPNRSFRREDRPRIQWPGNARVAFWVAPNIEYYEIDPPKNPVRASWQRPVPDILNWSWRDYGNRVGVWRCLKLFDKHDIRSSISLNAAMCERLPEVVQSFVDRGWELFTHGLYNTRFLFGLSPEQEFQAIRESCDIIEQFCGKRVRGILTPALTYNESTIGNIASLGLDYMLDLFDADVPLPVGREYGKLISVPYQVEMNDWHVIVRDGLSAGAYVARFKAHFERLHAEAEHSGTVVSLPLHPYLIGLPQYAWALDEILSFVRSYETVWVTSAAEIADWYRARYADQALAKMSVRDIRA